MSHYHKDRRAWFDDLKVEIGCADCGYSAHPAALPFHHISDDKLANVSRLVLVSREAVMEEIERCVLLCANCHKRRHIKPPPS